MAQSLPIPFMKAAQTEPLQANHQFTPDAIGFIITFLIDQLAKRRPTGCLRSGKWNRKSR